MSGRLSTPVWGWPSLPAEVIDKKAKLPVCLIGLASASFAFGGKYHHPGSASVMPPISPTFGNCDEKISGVITIPQLQVGGPQGQAKEERIALKPAMEESLP